MPGVSVGKYAIVVALERRFTKLLYRADFLKESVTLLDIIVSVDTIIQGDM